jgi:hypothetical protein
MLYWLEFNVMRREKKCRRGTGAKKWVRITYNCKYIGCNMK